MFKFCKLNNAFFSQKSTNALFNGKISRTFKYQSRFDQNLDWFSSFLITKGLSFARVLAIVNVGLYIYANFRYNRENKWRAIEGVSYSVKSLQNKEYTPLFTSLLGSYRI